MSKFKSLWVIEAWDPENEDWSFYELDFTKWEAQANLAQIKETFETSHFRISNFQRVEKEK